MKFATFLFAPASLLLVLPSPLRAEETPRVVSVGGDVTEIVYALGAGDSLVGADTSSVFPEAATKLPMVGYQRALSAEGVLSLNPTLILATSQAGPPPTLEQLRGAGVELVEVPADCTVDGARRKIGIVAAALGLEAEGARLLTEFDASIERAKALTAAIADEPPKVLFVYARGGGVVNVAGTGTSADAIIELAGGRNAVAEYSGYRPLTAEGSVKAAPEYLLIPSRGLESIGGAEGFLNQPGLALTPAGRERNVVAIDDLLLLGFGPRLGEAILALAEAIHSNP